MEGNRSKRMTKTELHHLSYVHERMYTRGTYSYGRRWKKFCRYRGKEEYGENIMERGEQLFHISASDVCEREREREMGAGGICKSQLKHLLSLEPARNIGHILGTGSF